MLQRIGGAEQGLSWKNLQMTLASDSTSCALAVLVSASAMLRAACIAERASSSCPDFLHSIEYKSFVSFTWCKKPQASAPVNPAFIGSEELEGFEPLEPAGPAAAAAAADACPWLAIEMVLCAKMRSELRSRKCGFGWWFHLTLGCDGGGEVDPPPPRWPPLGAFRGQPWLWGKLTEKVEEALWIWAKLAAMVEITSVVSSAGLG